jgi:nucleotide-binding universal stress UspA family protein
MRALIGIDGSQGSLVALDFVARLLTPEKDKLFLYYSPPPVYVRAAHDACGTAGALQSHLATAVLDKARQQLPTSWQAPAQSIIGEKQPREGILVAADEQRADLIVLGARGAGPLRQPTLGSVARHIIHYATIPVLIVRGVPLRVGLPIRVLLASDGSEISRHAADILHRFSWPAGSTGDAITVAESTAEGRIPGWLVEQLETEQLSALGMGSFAGNAEEQARLRRETSAWYGTLPAIFAGREPHIVAGHAPDQILKAIVSSQPDLVVVGARRQGAVRRLLLGSVSEYVVTHAPCSVLVVRGHERP